MSPVHFRHVGGSIVADHGGLSLAAARALSRFYRCEATVGSPPSPSGSQCLKRAHSLDLAIEGAMQWRRAAGWSDPDNADSR